MKERSFYDLKIAGEIDKIPQDTAVRYEYNGITGTGKVVGLLTDVVNRTYLIEPDISIYLDSYQYSHFGLPESYLFPIQPNVSQYLLDALKVN